MSQTAGPSAPPTRVFMSYRTSSNSHGPALLKRSLEGQFGPANVFYDLHKVAGGDSLHQRLTEGIANSDVLVVLIGPRFVRKPIAGDTDWVSFELNEAQRTGKPVIPVLDGTTNRPKSLPTELLWLSDLSHLKLRTQDYDTDFAKVVDAITRQTTPETLEPEAQRILSAVLATEEQTPTVPAEPVPTQTRRDKYAALSVMILMAAIVLAASWNRLFPNDLATDRLPRIEKSVTSLDITPDGHSATITFDGAAPKSVDVESRDVIEHSSFGDDADKSVRVWGRQLWLQPEPTAVAGSQP